MRDDIATNRIDRLDASRPSGRFVLRLPSSLHARLRHEANAAGVSLNELCVRKLGAVSSDLPDAIMEVVARSKHTFGDTLLGLVLYGSWARGTASTESDIDLMVVLDRRVPLNMRLYRHWSEEERVIDGHDLDIHFTHLPTAGELPSGLWAEISMDGRVVHDSDLIVTRTLSAIRRRIAAGDLVRRSSHGQPYWVEGSKPCET